MAIKDTVRAAILPTVEGLGYSIWDVTYSKIGSDYHLEITIDSENGINIEDCERVHRAIDPILDECDPIEGFYYLEVSSPGIERELRSEEHFLWAVGERVEAKLFTAVGGKKSILGILKSYEDGCAVIENAEGEVKISKSDISRITTIFFDDEK
jgi:ribosome maturation factor RimP